MVELLDKTAQLGREIESYARSLGAEIYGVASAAIYETKFPGKPSPSKFVPGARSIIILGLPFSRTIMDTVPAPALTDIYQSGAERTAGDGRHINSPPAGAERFYHGPENEMLTHAARSLTSCPGNSPWMAIGPSTCRIPRPSHDSKPLRSTSCPP